eukprot:2768827-Rhodomonas_salina.1
MAERPFLDHGLLREEHGARTDRLHARQAAAWHVAGAGSGSRTLSRNERVKGSPFVRVIAAGLSGWRTGGTVA